MVTFSGPALPFDGQIEYLQRSGSHVAFPDVISWCGYEVLAFREGNTHAADKGLVRVVLDPTDRSEVLTFEDNSFDLRNPYFHHNSDGLFLYVTVFDYENHEFKGTREFKIFNATCDLTLTKESETDFIIYGPSSSSLASYSNSLNDIQSLFDEKVFVTTPNLGVKTRVFDEEISFFMDVDNGGIFGIGRNQKDAGKPLLIYEQKNNGQLVDSSWCGTIYDSALVSPKVYVFDNGYHVSYSSRRLLNDDAHSSKNQLGIHWVSFLSQSALLKCSPSSSSSFYFEADIDGGYQTYNMATDRLFFYARLSELDRFNVYYVNEFLGN